VTHLEIGAHGEVYDPKLIEAIEAVRGAAAGAARAPAARETAPLSSDGSGVQAASAPAAA
jgi:hypothetical protein